MAFKTVVAVASGGEEDEGLLSAAARLARLWSAHVRVMPAFREPDADFIHYGLEKVLAFERQSQKRLEALAHAIAAREGLGVGHAHDGAGPSMVVEQRDARPARALADACVLADLALFTGSAARDPSLLGALFAQTLITARLPVLLVKNGDLASETAAIAWDGSAEAGRAVRAALPVLQRCRDVVILQNGAEIAPPNRSAAEPGRLSDYLARHGVSAIQLKTVEGSDVAASLLDAARQRRCDILIAGGFGRPRLYELVLGGTTSALADAADGPHVLLAH